MDTCNNEITRDRILLLFWRAWYLREDCIHGDGKALVSVSADFLQRYEIEIMQAAGPEPDAAGKISLFPEVSCKVGRSSNESQPWIPPPAGSWKIHTDASFLRDSDKTGLLC